MASWLFHEPISCFKDSPIKTVEDLKGKVIASPGYGTGPDIPLRAMLAKHGLQDKRDVTIVEAKIPTMAAMLKDRKVEMIALSLPFSASPDVRATTRTLFTQAEAMGVTELAMWVARQSFIEKDRGPLVDFMEDTLLQAKWYLDPANHDAAVKIAAEVTSSTARSLEQLAVSEGPPGRGLLQEPQRRA